MQQNEVKLLVYHDNFIKLLNGCNVMEQVIGEYERNQIITCMDSSVLNIDITCLCRVIDIQFFMGLCSSGYTLTLQLENKTPQQVSDTIIQNESIIDYE